MGAPSSSQAEEVQPLLGSLVVLGRRLLRLAQPGSDGRRLGLAPGVLQAVLEEGDGFFAWESMSSRR